jgi:hypothetical protein
VHQEDNGLPSWSNSPSNQCACSNSQVQKFGQYAVGENSFLLWVFPTRCPASLASEKHHSVPFVICRKKSTELGLPGGRSPRLFSATMSNGCHASSPTRTQLVLIPQMAIPPEKSSRPLLRRRKSRNSQETPYRLALCFK